MFRRLLILVCVACLPLPTADAQRMRQLSDFRVERLGDYALDDAGSTAFYVATTDPAGTNPDHVAQIFKRALPGGAAVQVTTLGEDVRFVDVSDDGSTILFASAADPLGTNPDGAEQLFLADGSGAGLTQLTTAGAGSTILEMALAGGGARAVFFSDADLTGGNAAGVHQLFTILTDGTGLAQLTSATTAAGLFTSRLAIDDPGVRIAFVDTRDLTGANADGSAELFRILSSGAALAQVTADEQVQSIAVAGNGSFIFYGIFPDIFYIPFTGPTPTFLVEGSKPSATDNGRDVFYETGNFPGTIATISTLGGAPSDIYTTSTAQAPIVAGSGARVLITLDGDAPTLADPDGIGLIATEGSGANLELVVDVGEDGNAAAFEMTADGSKIVFPWGSTDFFDTLDLYLADVDTGAVTPVTTQAGAVNPDITDDGSTIVFSSDQDLTVGACGFVKLYRVDAVGTNLTQIVPDSCPDNNTLTEHAEIAADGSTVVFQASGIPLDGAPELFSVAAAGGTVGLVTNDDSSFRKTPRVDSDGSWAVYQSTSNVTGGNPDQGLEVFRTAVDGSTLEQITDFSASRPDISGDGDLVVFESDGDPLATNPEANRELFLYEVSTDTLTQLTTTASGRSRFARISPNGSWVAFWSEAPIFDSSGDSDVYRIELATGTIERAGGGFGEVFGSMRLNLELDVDDDGNVAMVSRDDPTGTNRDGSVELWISEFDEAPAFTIGAGDPTELSWNPSPTAIAYDLIRGDLANLAFDVGSVDLGPVVCLEDDSDDAIGTADALQPTPGQGLFYLRRGTPGDLVGPGSYGTASDAVSERVPASGGCAG